VGFLGTAHIERAREAVGSINLFEIAFGRATAIK
jgi:hypothetical protein